MTNSSVPFLDTPRLGSVGHLDSAQKFADAAAEAVLGLQRFINIVLIHDPKNDAVAATLDSTLQSLHALAPHSEGRISFTFVGSTVFVCGELLKASRRVYEAAIKISRILKQCGASEITFDDQVNANEMRSLGSVLRSASKGRNDLLLRTPLHNIEIREVDAMLENNDNDGEQPFETRIVYLYAASLITLRRYFANISAERSPSPSRVKRVAQRLVSLSTSGDAALVRLTNVTRPDRDDADRAFQCAVISISIARRITSDSIALARIALEALICNVGRAALLGAASQSTRSTLPQHSDVFMPMATAALCIAGGGINRTAATHAITAYEVTWMEREAQLGSTYAGEYPPLVHSTIVRAARSLVHRINPIGEAVPMSPHDALEDLLRQPYIDLPMRKLLIAAMGFVPAGTLVELSDGRWAVVCRPSGHRSATALPEVRVITDRQGTSLASPIDLDLGAPRNHEGLRIIRIVEDVSKRSA